MTRIENTNIRKRRIMLVDDERAIPFVIPLRLAFSAASWLSIADIPEKIDIVDVFRKPEDVSAVIDDALKKKDRIKVFWMQLGIYNEDAERMQRKMA